MTQKELTGLLVDDDSVNRKVIENAITDQVSGIHLIHADEGKEAYSQVHQGVDFIVTDVMMRKGNLGWDADIFLKKLFLDLYKIEEGIYKPKECAVLIPTLVMSGTLDENAVARAIFYSNLMYSQGQRERLGVNFFRSQAEQKDYLINKKGDKGFNVIEKPIDYDDIGERINQLKSVLRPYNKF